MTSRKKLATLVCWTLLATLLRITMPSINCFSFGSVNISRIAEKKLLIGGSYVGVWNVAGNPAGVIPVTKENSTDQVNIHTNIWNYQTQQTYTNIMPGKHKNHLKNSNQANLDKYIVSGDICHRQETYKNVWGFFVCESWINVRKFRCFSFFLQFVCFSSFLQVGPRRHPWSYRLPNWDPGYCKPTWTLDFSVF